MALARSAGPSTAQHSTSIQLECGITESGVRTSLRTAPRIGECGTVNVELGLAEPAFARGATRIRGLLDPCFDGDVCVD